MFSILWRICSIVLFILRVIIISLFDTSQKWFKTTSIGSASKKRIPFARLAYAKDISEFAAANGYIIREYVVTTRDDYLLVVHKLEKHESCRRPTNRSVNAGIAYFHHGLLTNSELFLLGSEKDKNLPYLLVDLGYEVWLGNNRGNKYSRKHLKLSVADKKYWNFSLDEFALYDIPDTIKYIKNYYSTDRKITYIGFSQGCSQLFAALSLNPHLNDDIGLFVGLSPAIVPRDLNHVILKAIVDQTANDNSFLYNLFGERAILPSVAFWCWLMGPQLYQIVVDYSLKFLFGWNSKNISEEQKRVGYRHMFSNSSVKSIIHWFQIISARRFQMFDETCDIGLSGLAQFSHDLKLTTSRVAPFPIAHHLDVPMVLVYGDSDILVDIENTKLIIVSHNGKMAEKLLETIKCPGYEHMDTLWGNNVYNDVFEKVIEYLERERQEDPIRKKTRETSNGLLTPSELSSDKET